MYGDIIYISGRHITVENFEENNETIAVGRVADSMLRRDAAWWEQHNTID